MAQNPCDEDLLINLPLKMGASIGLPLLYLAIPLSFKKTQMIAQLCAFQVCILRLINNISPEVEGDTAVILMLWLIYLPLTICVVKKVSEMIHFCTE